MAYLKEVRLNQSHVQALRGADEVSTFRECGYLVIRAYKDDRLVVSAFCNSREEYERMVFPERIVGDDDLFGMKRR